MVAATRSSYYRSLVTLKGGLPTDSVAVIGIPDIYRLWNVGHTNPAALTAWSAFGICESVLYRAWSTSSTTRPAGNGSASG